MTRPPRDSRRDLSRTLILMRNDAERIEDVLRDINQIDPKLEADIKTIARIAAAVEAANDPEMAVDLVRNVIVPPIGDPIPFEIDAERRQALLAGMDELDVLLARLPELDTFVAADRPARPWAWPAL